MTRDGVLQVLNAGLPAHDYRVAFARRSARRVLFAMPEPPPGLPPERYLPLRVGAGLGWRDLGAAVALLRLLRRERPRLAIVHFYASKLVVVGPLLAGLAGVPCMATLTGLGRIFDSDRLRHRVLRVIYRQLLAMAMAQLRLVLAQNRSQERWLRSSFPRHADKVSYIGSAIDAAARVPERAVPPLTVLLVARLIPAKGIDDFLEVAARMRGSGTPFVLVGPSDPSFGPLHTRVREAAIRGEIEYRGALYGSELLATYEAAHVLYFPSRGEGLPRVVLEAAFAGLYPIAQRIPALEDLVPDGAGDLVTGPEEAIAALRRVLADEQLRLRGAAAFQRHVVREFDMDAFFRRLEAALVVAGAPLHAQPERVSHVQ